ncbi:hypothetical protein PEC18_19445 [Paucibacter sp. O1-1]|nr:hypothetical protein [Paucibacter sp. O1-1]MDA3827961.1 hypothetical protein [Paucibacter sp. O1-1]
MRISTGQMFQQSTNSILEKQSATNSIMGQISERQKQSKPQATTQ